MVLKVEITYCACKVDEKEKNTKMDGSNNDNHIDLPSLTTIHLQGCCDYIHRNMGYVVLESKLTGWTK